MATINFDTEEIIEHFKQSNKNSSYLSILLDHLTSMEKENKALKAKLDQTETKLGEARALCSGLLALYVTEGLDLRDLPKRIEREFKLLDKIIAKRKGSNLDLYEDDQMLSDMDSEQMFQLQMEDERHHRSIVENWEKNENKWKKKTKKVAVCENIHCLCQKYDD